MISLIALLLVCLIIVCLKLKIINNIYNPGVIFSLFWLIQLFVINLFLNYSVKNGYFIILLYAVVSLFAGIIGEKIFVSNKISIENYQFRIRYELSTKLSRYILAINIVLGCLFEILQLRSKGISVTSLFNLSSLIDINQANAQSRYYGEGGGSNVLLLFVYLSPLIGGFHWNFRKKKIDTLLSISSILPSFLSMVAENTKSGLIASICLFVSSFIVSSLILNKSLIIKFKYIVTGVIIFIASFYMFIFSMMLRAGQLNAYMFEIAKNKIMIYALGHIPAFSYWYTNSIHIPNGKGTYTFLGIYNFLGIVDRAQGVYKDAVVVNSLATNIYTVFRGLIMDYGLIGSILFVFLLFFLSTISYVYIKSRKYVLFNSYILINVYFFTFYSFLISSWTYTSYIIVMFLFIFYLIVCLKKEKTNYDTL